jgi:beta-galactosidase
MMRIRLHELPAACVFIFVAAFHARCVDDADVPLPQPVKAVWDLKRAWREVTPTRERVCVNGLWRWQPASAGADADAVPSKGWGYFKVPGCWPGVTDYLQKDSQTLYAHPSWKDQKLADVAAAWYQREITVPAEWTGRRIGLSAEYLNSLATVYVDGKKAGEIRFPAGELDLSPVCRPGERHVLSVLVRAVPIKGVLLSYADTATAREVKGSVARRGLCGDVYLVATPAGARVADVKAETSVRRSEVSVDAELRGLAADGRYSLHASIIKNGRTVREFASKPFKANDLAGGRFRFSENWKPEQLWDLHTPQEIDELRVSLVDAGGKVLDTTWDVRFGFRELWIDGRDFYLSGTRLFLSAVPLDNALIGAAAANYQAARQTLERLKRIGINLVYTHNYDCDPGAHSSFEEILRAADDVGMLVSLTQPHFSHYDWQAAGADENNGYAAHAAFYVRVAQNHPSVVFYSMSHNATGYDQDMNPDLIDGVYESRDGWAARNAKLALRAEAIVRRLDPGRTVYHHAGGNIGSMYTVNFYPNFAPVQELCDWFGHWASAGVKPLFLCEYGAPFTWDWTMYRGWYQGKREFGSAAVPWEFCLAEWDAQFLGDRAFAPDERERANLRWEARQFQAAKLWHRWDYPTEVGSPRFDNRNQILATYLSENWRAYRTRGVSGISPWEYGIYWTPRDGVDRARKQLKVDWDDLQRPGLSPDYVDRPVERIDTAFEESDWIPTAAGKALIRNNQGVLAYVAGPDTAFTAKDHNFIAGETIERQLVIINNSRQTQTFRCDWSLRLPQPLTGQKTVTVETGRQIRIPLRFELPAALVPGSYGLHANIQFGDRQAQTDDIVIHVLPAPPKAAVTAKLALFDPRGQTAPLLEKLEIVFRRVEADAVLAADDTLIVGKLALTVDGPAPDISRVRDGMKVLMFEQASDVLEKRLGFRATEYGLRQVFARIPDHPLLAGIGPEHLRDWRGEATTVPPRLNYEMRPQHGPTIPWCDIPVSRVWRCGNRGSVASVLIEKPARGDFRPILDGGFGLQYSPLMEYREGKGMVLFCQLDVTGRTEPDPAAQTLVANLLRHASTWKPAPMRGAVYAGERAGKDHLDAIGVRPEPYGGGDPSPEQVLVVGPGGGRILASNSAAVAKFLDAGGRLLAIALEQPDVDAILPFKVSLKKQEHISARFEPPGVDSPLAGIGPADVHNRRPRELPLVGDGATPLGDGILGLAPPGADRPRVVFCQLAPWQLDYRRDYGAKRTYRRASFLLTRLLANVGVTSRTPIVDRFRSPAAKGEKRWLEGLYLDAPEEWDDPYRFFRW